MKFENLNTPFGEQIRQARQMGGMPMDKINAKVVIEALSQEASSKQGVFLDGFPVTPGAAYQVNSNFFFSIFKS